MCPTPLPETPTPAPVAADNSSFDEYGYHDAGPHCGMACLMPVIDRLLPPPTTGSRPTRCLDVGTGNGYLAGLLLERGYEAAGVEPSAQGVAIARKAYPRGAFFESIITRDILARIDQEPFDVVLSTEVVEHLYDPRTWAAGCYNALRPGGLLICSTPYHGYLKNLVLALTGKFDRHFTALWDGGHIKFWSRKTLFELLREAGFTDLTFHGAGRCKYLWMSMVVTGRRPERG